MPDTIEITLTENTPEIAVQIIGTGPMGPQGPQGPQGEQGEQGEQGIQGETGPAGADGAAGQDGADGQDGQDGVSPVVTIAEISGGHSVTITDADHPGGQTFNVMDGADGQDGAPGQDGADGQDGTDGTDGVSPEVTITTITGGHRVTITDADHPTGQSFDVMDGSGGSITVDSSLSDSSTNPVQNKVIKSALDAKGTYSKPSGGIPKNDLASGVQASLGKADSALQSETDPTVPNWAKASSKPSYTASEVGAIAAPSSPATGAFLVWSGSAWTAQTLSTWQGGSY